MVERALIILLIWFVIGTVKFLKTIEQDSIQFQITGFDWVTMFPFYIVYWIISKKVKSNGN